MRKPLIIYYLSFPMYLLLDLDTLPESMEITYSVRVALRYLLADRRNFPFSSSTATRQREHVVSQLYKHGSASSYWQLVLQKDDRESISQEKESWQAGKVMFYAFINFATASIDKEK